MSWLETTLDELENETRWAYSTGAPPATEPASLAAIALAGHGRSEAAQRAGRWLAARQNENGSLGIFAEDPAPHWTTTLAILAWCACDREHARRAYPLPADDKSPTARALRWLVTIAGDTSPRNIDLGHDTTLKGWPWVEGTHSWMEPTAFSLLALKATGQRAHPRAEEAVRLLVDRLLPDGGANYGNTSVLGQMLRPHLEPTGVALLALAGEQDADGRIGRSIDYALREVGPETTAASLGYGLLGLAGQKRMPKHPDDWLAQAAERTRRSGTPWPRLALLALAALGERCPLVQFSREGAKHEFQRQG